MASSTVALGKVEVAQRKDVSIPNGWGCDQNGKVRQLELVKYLFSLLGPMKGGLSIRHRPEILHNVQHRLVKETVSVGLKWSVKC